MHCVREMGVSGGRGGEEGGMLERVGREGGCQQGEGGRGQDYYDVGHVVVWGGGPQLGAGTRASFGGGLSGPGHGREGLSRSLGD